MVHCTVLLFVQVDKVYIFLSSLIAADTKFSIILYCKRHQVLQENYVSVVDQKQKSVATLHYSKSVAAGQVLRKGSLKSVSYPNNKLCTLNML